MTVILQHILHNDKSVLYTKKSGPRFFGHAQKKYKIVAL
jgi:hypothetical protein